MPGTDATPVDGNKDALRCEQCELLLKDPVQTDDGVRLCKSCYEEIKSGQCSKCKVTLDKDSTAFPDRAVARELAELFVYCAYKLLGCDWAGPLKHWDGHCEQCRYKGIKCDHEGCDVIVEKGKLEEHKFVCLYRIVSCEYCSLTMIFLKLEQHHEKSCEEYPVTCDVKDCNSTFPRKQLKEHKLKSCIIEECLICQKKVFRQTGKEVPALGSSSKVNIDGSDSPKRASSETPDELEPHVCVVNNPKRPNLINPADRENQCSLSESNNKRQTSSHRIGSSPKVFRSTNTPQTNYNSRNDDDDPVITVTNLDSDTVSDDIEVAVKPSDLNKSKVSPKQRQNAVTDGDNTTPSSSPKLSRKAQTNRTVSDGDAYDASDSEPSIDIDRDPSRVEVPVKHAGSYKTKSRGRVVADGYEEEEMSHRIETDNFSDGSDKETTPQPDGEVLRINRDGSSTDECDSDKEGEDSGITTEDGGTGKTRKSGEGEDSGINTDDGGTGKTRKSGKSSSLEDSNKADDPHTEVRKNTPEDLPVHLSFPYDNFRHHQLLALRVVKLEDLFAIVTSQLSKWSQDIGEGHELIKHLQSEIAMLKEDHSKQQAYITSLETGLSQVKEEVQVVARKPGVDKNQLDKLQQLVSERDQYITQQKKDLDEIRRQVTNLTSKIDSNAVALQELQLKSRLSPNLRRPTTVGADVQYGNVISETRFIQLEHRVEDLARETSTTRAHLQELEIQLQAQVAATYNGSCLWRIPDVAKRRRDALEDRILSIYSPAFYTGRHGYKMCCRMYLNGDGMGLGTNISVFFVVMKGDYDALLKWPFEHKVSLILVDQTHRKHIVQTFKPTPDSSSFKRPVSDMNVASGCPQFASIDVLQDDRYVQADTMYIKCIVDTSKIFHP